MIITEYKRNFFGETEVFECTRLEGLPDRVSLLYRVPECRQLEDILLPKGTLSIGHFWSDRHYNCYHFIDPGGETIATYFNVCDLPLISDTEIHWRDWAIDILKTPDTAARVLDESELPEDLDLEVKTRIYASRDQILANLDSIVADLESFAQSHIREIKAACPDS